MAWPTRLGMGSTAVVVRSRWRATEVITAAAAYPIAAQLPQQRSIGWALNSPSPAANAAKAR